MMKSLQKGKHYTIIQCYKTKFHILIVIYHWRYYAFVESASAIPPSVRPPPYTHVHLECKDIPSKNAFVSVHNICGDLNKGQIPRNPMGQNVLGEPYPLWVGHTLSTINIYPNWPNSYIFFCNSISVSSFEIAHLISYPKLCPCLKLTTLYPKLHKFSMIQSRLLIIMGK